MSTPRIVHVSEAGNCLQSVCHQASLNAGWWNHNGLDLAVQVRDPKSRLGKAIVAEKLALVHSEVSEALEGHRKGKMDEHLAHRKSIEVELADAVIRIADLAGALQLDLGAAIHEKMMYNNIRPDHKPEARAAEGGKAY